MRVTATEAKNRFGALCLQSKRGPVVVEKAVAPDTVLLSDADDQRLPHPPRRLAPQFTIAGDRLALAAQASAGLDGRLLKQPVASLAAHARENRDALDAVISGVCATARGAWPATPSAGRPPATARLHQAAGVAACVAARRG